jgi:hypothetical protein
MSDYKLVNLVDAGLEDIANEITLPVICASPSNTFQNFNALTVSKTQVQFNIQIPSLATTFKRDVLVQSKCRLKIDFEGGSTAGYWKADQLIFSYGLSNALQAFPFNSSFSTIQSGINNSNITLSSRDVLPALLKMSNYEEMAKTNSLCPSLVDSFYYNYADGISSNSNVLGNYSSSTLAKEYQPRGVFPVTITDVNGVELPFSIKADNNGTNQYPSIYLEFVTTEPILFLSPFSSGVSVNQANFLGISGLTMTFTISAGAGNYMMSNASYATKADDTIIKTISNVELIEITECKALFNFQTIPAQLYDKILPKNVLNYNQYTCYPTSNNAVINANVQKKVLQSTNLQLNQIPSKILIYVKQNDKTSYDSNSFMVINELNVSFASKTGLLSGITQQQLYNLSIKNGLQMNYYEFSGEGVSAKSDGSISKVATIGSIVVLDPASDLSLEPQYSNMSGGQFNFSFTISVSNQSNQAITPTIYIVCVNSGIFITENGQSIFTTGMLSQEQVLETKSKNAITDTHTYEKQIVGGSIENIGGIHKHVKNLFSKNSEKEQELDHAKGESAGVMSSGAMSSGNIKKKVHKYM